MADRKPAAKEGGEVFPGPIDWWAVHQSFVEEKGAIVLSGSAWVRYQSIKLEADHIIFFRQTRELYAEGHIRLREGESEVSAEVAYVDIANDRGYLIEATLRVSAPAREFNPRKLNQGQPDQSTDADYAKAVQGEGALVSTRDPYGVYLEPVKDPQARLNLIFKAQTIIRESRLYYTAANAFFTPDDMADPLYGVKVGQLEFMLRDAPDPENPGKTTLRPARVRGTNAWIKVGPVPPIPLPVPSFTYDMTRHHPFIRLDRGKSNRFGYYGLSRIGWGLGGHDQRLFDPSRLYLDLDFRQKIGPAVGAEFKYETGYRPKEIEAANIFDRGRGTIRAYGLAEIFTEKRDDLDRAVNNRARRIQGKIDGRPRRSFDSNALFLARRARDGAGPASRTLDTYRHEERGMVDFTHHQPLLRAFGLDNVQLDFKYQGQTDRDFLLEYFPQNYLTMNQPEALASIRKGGDHYQAELLYRTSPHNFDGAPPRSPVAYGVFTDYEPALTYSLLPKALGAGFYLSGEGQAARVRREFERKVIDQNTYEAGRLSGRFQLERPFRFMGATWRPYVGAQAAAYDNSRGGGSIVQSAPVYGLDVSTRLYGTFPGVRNDELGIYGFRHILEPRVEYSAIGDPAEKPRNVLDFDEIDDLTGVQRVRLSLDQAFQTFTKPVPGGAKGVRTVGNLNMYMDIFPRQSDSERLLDGDHLDLFHVNAQVQILDAVQVGGDVGYSIEQKKVETASYSVSIDPGGRWRLYFANRYNFNDKDRGILGYDTFVVKLDLQLSERWGLSIMEHEERRHGLLNRKGTQNFRIALTRRYGPLVGSFQYSFDRNLVDKGFNFALAPAFTYRNLVVPSQHLLVDTGQVDEAGETPEERNFDPFNLINKSRKKKTAPAKPPASSPAPPPAGAPAVPAPQPESGGGPAPLSQSRPPAEVVEPARPPLKKRPANVGQDDWSLEPPVSASR